MAPFKEELAELDLAAALRQFGPAERRRLELFCSKANETAELSFFQSGSPTLSLTLPGGGEASYELGPQVTREKVNAAVVPLRLLWSRKNNASFASTCDLISAHTTVTPAGRQLADIVQRFREETVREAFENQGIQFQREDGFIPGKEIFEDWLYGDYLHDDELRRERIEPYRRYGAHEFAFLGTIWTLGRYYQAFSELVVEPILLIEP